MIEDLISLKEHFWCHHCERGLFPNSCLLHVKDAPAQGEDVEEEVEEEDEEEK